MSSSLITNSQKSLPLPPMDDSSSLHGQKDVPLQHMDDASSFRGRSEKGSHQADLEIQVIHNSQGETFDEGGWRAYLTLLGSWLVMFSTFGYTNAYGVFQSYYQLVLLTNESPSNISWIGSLSLCLQFEVALISGPLYDKGYFTILTRLGAVLYILSIFMTSLVKEYYQAVLAQGLLGGIAIGIMFLPSLTIVTQYFKRKRSLAMGIVTTGSSIGGIVFPIALNKLFFNPSVGFGNGVRTVGYLITGLIGAALLLMRPHPIHKSKPKAPPPDVKAIFRDRIWLLAVLGSAFQAMGLFFPIFYIQVFALFHGIESNLAFYTIAILNAASVFGRTLPNYFSDRIGPFNVLVSATFGLAILSFCMFGATNPGGVVAFSILYGFFSGTYISMIGPCFISTAKDDSELGARQGLAYIPIGIALLIGTPISGALLKSTPGGTGFYAPIIFAGVCVATGTFFVAIARQLVSKAKGTWRV